MNEQSFARVTNDANGNPRYVIHFLDCEPESWKEYTLTLAERYTRTCKLMNKLGGRKYHNKQYGGGIVFQSYSLPETLSSIQRIKEAAK